MASSGFSIVDGSEYTDRAAANREYLALANEVFGFNESGEDFARLLPKLFGPGRDAAAHTTFAVSGQDSSMVACAGRFPVDFIAGNTFLKAFGIGNVGVRKELRKRGLMSAVMTAAVNQMIVEGAVFSFLGGSRHRYKHFGYERAGVVYGFELSAKTLRALAESIPASYTLTPLSSDDGAAARFIAENDRRPLRAIRDPREIYDILTSWHSVPYVLYENGAPRGWAVVKAGLWVTEAVTVDNEHLLPLLALLSKVNAPLMVKVPEYDTALYDTLWPLAESWHTGADNMICVFDYRKLVSALLEVKAGYALLSDGTLNVIIDGIARTEQFKIEVTNGVPSVTDIDPGTDPGEVIRLSDADATGLFLTRNAPVSRRISPAAASWFPLPLYIGSPNDV
ncbi:MAG: GNAT family N-acetyltransferase [Clostridia bacterium]|nr:GNAT family N-acetyltransferase [Clostridia bacterium]